MRDDWTIVLFLIVILGLLLTSLLLALGPHPAQLLQLQAELSEIESQGITARVTKPKGLGEVAGH